MGKAIRSANHHYIPRGILRRFCFDEERLYYVTKRRRPLIVEERSVDSVFKRRHLNTYPMEGGGKDYGLELFYAKFFDSRILEVVSIFERCVEGGACLELTDEDLALFVQFFFNHMKISPDFHEPIVETVSQALFFEESIREYEELFTPLSEEERSRLYQPDIRKRIIDQSRVRTLRTLARQPKHILDILAGKSIVLARPARPNKQFIVASNPVVRFLNKTNATLYDDEIELWTTLTPHLAVALTNAFRSAKPLELDDRAVRKLNVALVRQSQSFGGATRGLVQSLAADRG
jgi:hypothetical protein